MAAFIISLDFERQFDLVFRQHFVDRRKRRWHQNYRLRVVQNHGPWKLQPWPWHGPHLTGCRNLLVLAARVFRRGQDSAKNFFQSWHLVTRGHLLPVPLRPKGMKTIVHPYRVKLLVVFWLNLTYCLQIFAFCLAAFVEGFCLAKIVK